MSAEGCFEPFAERISRRLGNISGCQAGGAPIVERLTRDASFLLLSFDPFASFVRVISGALIDRPEVRSGRHGPGDPPNDGSTVCRGSGSTEVRQATVYYLGQRKYRLNEMCFTFNWLTLGAAILIVGVFVIFEGPVRAALFGELAVPRAL